MCRRLAAGNAAAAVVTGGGMRAILKSFAFAALLGLAACVSVPTGPSVMVLPGTGKSFDQFRFDDGACRQYAYDQIGGQTAARAQEDSAVKSAVVGTAIGALAGAAIGGNSSGAAAGAGVGLLGGSMVGAGAAESSAYGAQRRYDVAYQQCMYAKGHRIPVSGRFAHSGEAPQTYYPPPPPPNQAPPR
jgi:YMGG-like Gly-zipper